MQNLAGMRKIQQSNFMSSGIITTTVKDGDFGSYRLSCRCMLPFSPSSLAPSLAGLSWG
jgi:hypothetical protein